MVLYIGIIFIFRVGPAQSAGAVDPLREVSMKTAVELKNKTVLITGAAGFIGSALVRRLLSADDAPANIVGVDNLNDYYDPALKRYRLDRFAECAAGSASSWTFRLGDISDKAFVESLFAEFAPSVVVNMAAQTGVRYSIDHPDVYMLANVMGFFNILESCRRSLDCGGPGVEHLVFASSSSVYGNCPKVPFEVTDRTDSPVSLYAATKKSNELMAHAYAKLYDLPVTGLRFFTVYGPAGRPDMFYYSAADTLVKGGSIRIFNYGRCKRDFTYIDDVVEGVSRVMRGAPARRTGDDGLPTPPYALYNIGRGRPEPLPEFIDALQNELIRAGLLPADYDLAAHREFLPMQRGDVPVTFADCSALERDFGFRPHVDFRDGVRKFVSWYRDYHAAK